MNQITAALLAFVAIFLLINGIFWFRRYRRYIKPIKKAEPEDLAMIRRDNEIQRRLDREQEEAVKYITLRNQTLALYEQVRRDAEARERKAAQTAEGKSAPDAKDVTAPDDKDAAAPDDVE